MPNPLLRPEQFQAMIELISNLIQEESSTIILCLVAQACPQRHCPARRECKSQPV